MKKYFVIELSLTGLFPFDSFLLLYAALWEVIDLILKGVF